MEKQTRRNSYLSKELLIHNVVKNPCVNIIMINGVINNLKNTASTYNNLKKEANKQPLMGQGYLAQLSKTRIENAKKSLPIKEQELVEQRQSVINDNNYTEDMAMAIEKFDKFVAKEYGLYFS